MSILHKDLPKDNNTIHTVKTSLSTDTISMLTQVPIEIPIQMEAM